MQEGGTLTQDDVGSPNYELFVQAELVYSFHSVGMLVWFVLY